jgi:hypothetical protein
VGRPRRELREPEHGEGVRVGARPAPHAAHGSGSDPRHLTHGRRRAPARPSGRRRRRGDDPEDADGALGDHAPQPAARADPGEPGRAGADQAGEAQARDPPAAARDDRANARVGARPGPLPRGRPALAPRLRRPAPGRGVRAAVGLRRRPRTDRRARPRRRVAEGNEDRPDPGCGSAAAGHRGPRSAARRRTRCGGRPALPPPRGDVFRDADYQNWRRRNFDPVATAAGAVDATPYTLRHSFASLRVQAGWNALEIAHEMGNSPEVVQRDYSHLFREFTRGERLDPESVIADARSAVLQS